MNKHARADIDGLTVEPESTLLSGLNEWSGKTISGLHWQVLRGDCVDVLRRFDANRFQCAVTSPPYYWQRDYKVAGQIGLEPTINLYVDRIVECMAEIRRVLRNDGVLFLNMGDTYYSGKGM